MPFTVSHIVAAVPLNKRLGKYTALSPLIIGSMTPDVAYLTPYLVHQRMDSHSLLGIYLFCIPMGLTIYFLYHLLMAPVVVSFLPKNIQKHVHPDLFIGKLPAISTQVLLTSLILGAITHVVWDFFTHQSGIPQYSVWMDTPLFNLDNYDIMPYRILQHLSSVLGLALLLYWIFAWYKRKKNTPSSTKYWQAPRALKIVTLISVLSMSFVLAMLNGYRHLPETDVLYGLYGAQIFLRHALLAGMATFLVSCCTFGLVYQFFANKKKG